MTATAAVCRAISLRLGDATTRVLKRKSPRQAVGPAPGSSTEPARSLAALAACDGACARSTAGRARSQHGALATRGGTPRGTESGEAPGHRACSTGSGPTLGRTPGSRARRGSTSGMFDRPRGMHRCSNAAELSPRAAWTGLAGLYWTCSPTNARSTGVVHDSRPSDTPHGRRAATDRHPEPRRAGADRRRDAARPLRPPHRSRRGASKPLRHGYPGERSSSPRQASATSGGPGSSQPCSAGSSRCWRPRTVRRSSWWRARAGC